MPTVRQITQRLKALADPERAADLQRFFKTGPGGYGENDRFLGITVPVLRRVAKASAGLSLAQAQDLLQSPWHEHRLLALIILVQQFQKADEPGRQAIYEFYLANTGRINNWDLVDVACEHIVGGWLHNRSRRPLYHLARSPSLWERRISIVSTLHFIRRNDFADTLGIAEILVHDPHDLIHKALGWMLREVGKRDRKTEEAFLRKHCLTMPRTMLRYAIERFPPARRRQFLDGTIPRTN